MSYMPGVGLGKNLQGPPKFNITGTLMRKTSSGYKPSKDEVVKKGDRLEDYFVKEKAKRIYQGQLESFWDKETKAHLSGFEILANDIWPKVEEEVKAVVVKEEPVD